MRSIRDYINLVEKVTLNPDGSAPQTQTVNGVTSNAPANSVQTGSGGVLKTGSGAAVTSGTPAPAADAAAAAKAKLTPSQLKWLGGADATDPAIMARMPKPQPGEQAGGAPAAPAAPAPAAAPVDDRNEMDKASDLAAAQKANGVDPATGQNVTMPDGTNPETGEKTTPAAPAAAAPVNRDTMPFGQAFADAKAKGEKQFAWKGKQYAVQMAKPQQSANKVPPKVGQLPMQQQAAIAAGTTDAAVNPQGMAFGGGGLEESTGYSELQRLVSLINYR